MKAWFSRYIISVRFFLNESKEPNALGTSAMPRPSMMETIVMKKSIGFMHGSVMRKNVWNLLAPSISAASKISTGMPVMPAMA